MRIRQTRIEELYIKPVSYVTDADGTDTIYGAAVKVKATKWPAGGRVQSEMYGSHVQDVYNVKIEGGYTTLLDTSNRQPLYKVGNIIIKLNDGVCIFSSSDEQPDYRIISIKCHRHLLLEVMRI